MIRKKIAVIFTGGTIGSVIGPDGYIAPDQQSPYALLDRYSRIEPEVYRSMDFDCSMPYQILSENLDDKYLLMLIAAVGDALRQEKYAAVIVCHGTDTLQYSAAALGLLYAEEKVPIYLISSNYPLEDERANGLANFRAAVHDLVHGHTGVLVPYRNSDGNTYLHRGTYLLAHRSFNDELYSMHDDYLGFWDREGNWQESDKCCSSSDAAAEGMQARVEDPIWKGLMEPDDVLPKLREWIRTNSIRNLAGQLWAASQGKPNQIQWIQMYPGYVCMEPEVDVKYIMLETYHSGTLCVNEGLRAYVEAARKRGIPVYIVGMDSTTGGYETVREYQALDVICVTGVPPITFYCYLWLCGLLDGI